MIILRFLVLLSVISVLVSGGLYLFTRNERYLTWAKRIARVAVAIVLVFAALLILERLVVI